MAASADRSTFSVAVSQLLNSWTALQLAVEHGFGGAESQEKAKWMVYAIETWFRENDNVESFEVEDFLEDVCNSEFDLILEDNSVKEISRLLCLYYRLCLENKLDELNQHLQNLPKASIVNCQQQNAEEEEFDCDDSTSAPSSSASQNNSRSHQPADQVSSTEGNEDMDVSEDQPVEDGWQVIKRGKKKK
ncbi:rRNA accumulation- protein [Bulinus truncatus]|nr:rRNA accumulation- protein [Bulinus truncatus]